MSCKNITLVSVPLTVCFYFLTLCLCSPLMQAAEVTLTIGDGSGYPGSSENLVEVMLNNTNHKVRSIQVDVCDIDNYLSCEECDTTARTTAFSCLISELDNGCCRVIVAAIGDDSIEEGTGTIVTLAYNVSEEAPAGECRDLNPEEEKVSDDTQQPLAANLEAGEFCFLTSTSTTVTTTTIPPVTLSPSSLWKSHWVPLPRLIVIEGNDTHFMAFDTTLGFKPAKAVCACFPLVWDNFYIWDLVWVMPGWFAGMEDQTVTVTVTTGDEIVEGSFEIKMLPCFLDQ